MEKILPPSGPQTCRGSTYGREDSRVRTFLYLTDRKKKLLFEPVELSTIRQCLLDWRIQQIRAEEEEVTVELIGELFAMFT